MREDQSDDSTDGDDDELDDKVIIWSVLGSFFGLFIICLCCYCICIVRKRRDIKRKEEA